MNHTCRTVFNHSRKLWQAVPETAKARGKGGAAPVRHLITEFVLDMTHALWANDALVFARSTAGVRVS